MIDLIDNEWGSIDTEQMLGETITKIEKKDDYAIKFQTADGQVITMQHEQDCCEDVTIEEIFGDLDDLIGSPLVMAEAVENNADSEKSSDGDYRYESATWTFYKLGTNKGSVTLRWLGVSNGYYSESVDLNVEFGKINNG